MSGQRYNQGDSRFPRDRSPSRPNYPGLHPSRSAYVGQSSADQSEPPRGPRAHGDHRGRGFSSRGDFRGDFRDREPLRGPRDASPPGDRAWRDYDRRDSAHDDFRPGRDSIPRDGDASRGRRTFREGVPSRFGDPRGPPPFSQRDDFSRGRGRNDWAPRGRGRGSYDDRPNNRPRSRSPRGYRSGWDREQTRDDRQDDRFDSPRLERRESESFDREERAREADRYRRELERPTLSAIPSNRPPNASPDPNSPSAAFGDRRLSSTDRDRDRGRFLFRSQSSTNVPSSTREASIGGQQPSTARESLPSAGSGSRVPSPVQAAPEVPAFGSISHRSTSNSDGPWNVWKAPTEPKPAHGGGLSEPSPAPGDFAAPTAPRAPKAQRTESLPQEAYTSVEATTTSAFARSPDAVSKVPTGPRLPPDAPSGPKAQSQPDASPPTAPKSTLPLKVSPNVQPGAPPAAPLGPRSSQPPQANARFGSNVPTGPRSTRGPPMPNPRVPIGPASERPWSRSRIDTLPNRTVTAIVPAKRDFDGMEVDDPPTGQHHPSEIASTAAASADKQLKTDDAEEKARLDSSEPSAKSAKMVYSSDEDDMAISELDSVQNEEKYERNKARLESIKIDLSSDALRASSILRQIALLNCLLLQEPSSFFESKQLKTQARQISEAKTDSETPKIDEPEEAEPVKPSPRVTPSPISTPMLANLPFYSGAPLTPMSELDALQENYRRHENAVEALTADLKQRAYITADYEARLREEFSDKYLAWRQHTRELDRLQREREEAERQESAEEVTEQAPPELSPTVQPAAEPTRRRGFNSEYELQKVLELSREEAEREAQARKEKELANAKPDYDREAVIPNVAPDLSLRIPINDDINRLQDPNEALSFWDFQPPADDFTREEHDTMLQNFKEYPKKFGKIAQGLRGRTYKDCINHYYATKWNQQYKPPRDKRRSRGVKAPRARGNAGLRPRANQLISNLDDAKPELYDGEEATAPLMAVTESGRPRRAAAPNFREREQADASSSAPRRGQKTDPLSSEKPGRKPKGTARERSRRTKATSAARQPSMSPEKQLQEQQHGESGLGSSHADLESPQASANVSLAKPEPQPMFGVEYQAVGLGPGAAEPGKMQTVRGGHTGPSSYWSVHEVTQFPGLVRHYGTDWVAIANAMGTKSATMVKNYFGRLKNTGKELELESWAREADSKRERGEASGAPPTPPSKRPRPLDQAGPSAPRPLAPNTDAADPEDELPAAPVAAYVPAQPYPDHRHSRMSSFGQSSRAAIPVAPQATHPSYAPAAHAPHAPHALQEMRHAEVRPSETRPAEMRPAVEHHIPRASEQTATYPARGREVWESPGRSGDVYSSPAFQRHPAPPRQASPPRYSAGRPLFPPAPAKETAEERLHYRRAESPQPIAIPRYVESPNPRSSAAPYFDPTRHAGPSVGRDEARSGRPYSQSQAQESPRPVLPVAARTEPRKSNLAAILNAEPDEPKPAIPPATPGSRIHTPPQYGAPAHPGYGPPVLPPSRPLSQPSRQEPPPDPSRIPLQHQRVAYGPSETMESKQREPSSFRPAWPMTKGVPPRERQMEAAPSYDHRTAMRTYDARYNTSPPPAHEKQSYDHRLPHYAHTPYRAASPPGRAYAHTPTGSMTHSRDSSSSRIPPNVAPLPPSRESQYPPDHRQAHRMGERGPPPPPAMHHPSGPIYTPHAQHSPAPHYAQSVRHHALPAADWTQGIQYRDRPSHERGGEAERERDWEREHQHPREHQREQQREHHHEHHRDLEGSSRDARYGAVSYGPVTYQPRSDRG